MVIAQAAHPPHQRGRPGGEAVSLLESLHLRLIREPVGERLPGL